MCTIVIVFQVGELEKEIKDLKEQNHFLKREMVKSNLQYLNLKENTTEELRTLKATNDHEINFFTKNHEALKVGFLCF